MKVSDLQEATWFRSKEMTGLFYYQGLGTVIRIGNGAVVIYNDSGSMDVENILPPGSETTIRL